MITSTSLFDLSNKFIYSTDFDKKIINVMKMQIFHLIKRDIFGNPAEQKIYRFILRNKDIKFNLKKKFLPTKIDYTESKYFI